MSAFLGPIHKWLYNKIQWNENLLEDILNKAEEKDYKAKVLKEAAGELYGTAERRPLTEVIDEENIHGWLQKKIESLEYRMAYVITNLLDSKVLSKDELEDIYSKNGRKAYEYLDKELENPDEIFKSIYDFLLDGMPCDRVNKPIEGGKDYYIWAKSKCLHTSYWESVGGDIEIYNELRRVWIKSFVPKEFEFKGDSEGNHEIRKKVKLNKR